MRKNIAMTVMLALTFMVLSMGMLANTLIVTNPADSEAAGTLRDALLRAADGDTIAIQANLADICSTCTIQVHQKKLTFLGGIEGKAKRTDLPAINKFKFLQKSAEINFKNCNIPMTNSFWNGDRHTKFTGCKIIINYHWSGYRNANLISATDGGTIDFNKCIFKYNNSGFVNLHAYGPDTKITVYGCEIYTRPEKGLGAVWNLTALNKGTIDVGRGTTYYCHEVDPAYSEDFIQCFTQIDECAGCYTQGTTKCKVITKIVK